MYNYLILFNYFSKFHGDWAQSPIPNPHFFHNRVKLNSYHIYKIILFKNNIKYVSQRA